MKHSYLIGGAIAIGKTAAFCLKNQQQAIDI